MKNAPVISVLIPTYNRGDLIAATLRSILDQTLQPQEIIVVDDGSTDATASEVESVRNTHPAGTRVRYVRQVNQGKSVALNHGLRLIAGEGEWIAYDDSDDIWRPEKLALQMEALSLNSDCGACFTDALFVNGARPGLTAFARANKRYSSRFGRIEDGCDFMLRAPHGVFMQTVVLRKDVMRRVGEFDPRLRVGQDTDFLFLLGRETPLCYVNEPLVEIDRTTERSQGLMTQYTHQSLTRLQARELSLLKWTEICRGEGPEITRLIRSQLATNRNNQANYHLKQGDFQKARQVLLLALRTEFELRRALKLAMMFVAPARCAAEVESKALSRERRNEP
jgi:glycosyltransferase involved in cell wall biosynthesis